MRWLVIAAVAAAQIVLVATWVAPGPLSIDEVAYHRMSHDLVAGRGLTIWNGWEDLPSRELESMYVRASDDRLVAQYPYGWPTITAPAFYAFGHRGLFLVNALAFVGVLLLVRRIALQLVEDEKVAIGACAILAAGTFAWEYSMAAWPHMASVLALLGACSLAVAAWQQPPGRRAVTRAAAAGLIIGLGATLRFDVLFCIPVLATPFLFGQRARLREAVALGVGLVPGLAFLSATNMARWSNPSPLSYGRGAGLSELASYVPLLLGGALLIGLVWAATRPRAKELARRHHRALLVASATVVIAIVAVPQARALLVQVANGLQVILLDVRTLPLDGVESSMDRTQDGAIVYWGAFKKALFQSMPYIVLIVVPMIRAVRRGDDRTRIAFLCALPVPLLVFFAFRSWHGGLSLNMRYMLPALPFVSILVALAVRDIAADAHRRWPLFGGLAAVLALVGYLLLAPAPDDLVSLEPFLLDTPLILGSLLAIAMCTWLLRRQTARATATLLLAGLAMGWSAAVAFGYDAWWAHERRSIHHDASAELARQLPDDGLLFTDSPDWFYGVVQYRPLMRIAIPHNDDFADAPSLIRHHLGAGRPVFGVMGAESWQRLERGGALDGLQMAPMGQLGPFLFGQIGPEVGADTRMPP